MCLCFLQSAGQPSLSVFLCSQSNLKSTLLVPDLENDFVLRTSQTFALFMKLIYGGEDEHTHVKLLPDITESPAQLSAGAAGDATYSSSSHRLWSVSEGFPAF